MEMSIPHVSPRENPKIYHSSVNVQAWTDWGKRFRALARENGETLGTISAKMGRAESSLRSWTNGTREINLSEFFDLCQKARVNPSQVLFGAVPMDAELTTRMGELARTILGADPSASADYKALATKLRHKAKS